MCCKVKTISGRPSGDPRLAAISARVLYDGGVLDEVLGPLTVAHCLDRVPVLVFGETQDLFLGTDVPTAFRRTVLLAQRAEPIQAE